jgi:linalool 8-monooxygenase
MTLIPRGPERIDLKDADLYLRETPHDLFAWLREHDPVYWNRETDGPGFWALTRYHDIVRVSTDPGVFSSARSNGGHRIFNENDVAGDAVETSMISMDPPDHLEYRIMLMPGFTPQRLKEMEAGIRARGVRLIETMIAQYVDGGRAPVNFVDAFAAPYAIQTLAELFGVSMADGDKLFEWSNAVVAEEDPELRPNQSYIDAKIQEMVAYSFALRAEREKNPGPDLISMLACAQADGAPMSPGKYLATFILMVVAGNETTRNSLSGGLLAFDRFPAARAVVMANPGVMRSCAQEIVRYVTPVQHMRRTATCDVELGGKTIRAGDKVVMWYAAGNRDPDVFAAPDEFNPARFVDPLSPRHVGFGAGQHVCLGQRRTSDQGRL